MTMNNLSPNEKIIFFFEQKLALLKQYFSITKKMQATPITQKENNLMGLISERQNCINRIQTIDKSIEKIKRTSRKKLNLFSDKFKGLIDNYLNAFMDIIKAVEPIDRKILVMVKNEDEEIKNELLKLQKNKRAAISYGPKLNLTPRYLDTKK